MQLDSKHLQSTIDALRQTLVTDADSAIRDAVEILENLAIDMKSVDGLYHWEIY
jgi:hypothetical protein